ncbi:MAG: hypothetical protein ACI8QS_002666 [Planctomycetota bacterium]|jgi:hypothetical protein
MDYFGKSSPRDVPRHLFSGAVQIDFESAIRGDPDKQNYTVCPRHWYMDAEFECADCGYAFTWSAQEQRTWFEEYDFWIGSCPKHCIDCRGKKRRLNSLRQEYDRLVGEARSGCAVEMKSQVLRIIDELDAGLGKLPDRIRETKSVLLAQIRKATDRGAGPDTSAGASES